MNGTIAERLARVRDEIARAAQSARRDPASIELVAVTKTRTAAEIAEAVAAGALLLGENYVQEARRKIPEATALVAPIAVRWHAIGPLQTNKAKYVPRLFHTVESLDRLELARALSARASAAGLELPVLVQVNIGREPQKSGCEPEATVSLVEEITMLPALAARGLMAIPPESDDPEASRPFFRALSELARDLARRGLLPDAPVVSMGMSHDFAVAIQEGATRVRIGTAIFGDRPPKTRGPS